MRIAVAALCVLALTAPASARYLGHNGELPCDVTLPSDIKAPNVQYSVRVVAHETMLSICAKGIPKGYDPSLVLACTFQKSVGFWPIYVSATVPKDQVGCLVKYEMAHMPPNYWAEPGIELPTTIDWLNAQKKASR